MHRVFLTVSLCTLAGAIVLTGCGQQPAQIETVLAQTKDDGRVPPGENKPIPPGENKPIPNTDPTEPPDMPPDTNTDPDTLPILPTLTPPTGEEKYEAAIGRAFLLMSDKKDKEALEALQEALAAQETEFVKSEIERVQNKIARQEAAQQAVADIKDILDAGRANEAATLAGQALEQYGDSDEAEAIGNLKRLADSLLSTQLEEKVRKERFLAEAEAARKANHLRTAVAAFDQAVASGADVDAVRDTYEGLRVKLAKYDDSRAKGADYRKDPMMLEQAVTSYKVAAEQWDTTLVRQEISETELALSKRRDRVAVADFETINDIGVPRAGHVVAEELIGHFRPRFDVVERAQSNKLLDEMKLSNGDLYDDDADRSEFGRLAKARYVVLGSVSRLGGIHVNARLVDTQTGLVVQTARVVASNPDEMANRLPALAKMLQMNDEQKRDYERRLAEQARPVTPPSPEAVVPPPPAVPEPVVAPAAVPAPIIISSPRPPEFGRVVISDFDGLRVIDVGVAPPPPVIIVDGPMLLRDRAFFVAIELGDNFFRRGRFHEALRQFEFALALNPGDLGVRLRLERCRPFCPPLVIAPVFRPRLIVLPFAEFRDPFRFPSTISPYLGPWTAEAIAPYYASRFDLVGMGELYWWMGRLGLTMRDVLTNPYARLTLGRALGARFFLMGSLREIASFDVTTHIVDAELNVQTAGARIRVQDANELRFRLGELARLTFLPPPQQVVVVQQQQVVQRQVTAARIEIGKGRFSVAIELFREVIRTQPNHVEARQGLLQLEVRQRQADLEAAQLVSRRQQQGNFQQARDRQIALAAASEATRRQAQRDAAARNAQQQQLLAQQQLIAQQNLIAQAQLAQRQNNLEQRVALLESANALRPNDTVVQELAQARTALAVERQKRKQAEQALAAAEAQKQRDAELAKIQEKLALEQKRRQEEKEARAKAEAEKVQVEYNRFLDLGQKAMVAQKYPAAVTAFQNARRLKPSPEIEQLVSTALMEQARADAAKKDADERKKLEAQLAKEAEAKKQLEIENAKLQAKYTTALRAGRAALQQRNYPEAVTSFKLAAATIPSDEANRGLRDAQDQLAKANAAADAEAKAKADAAKKDADANRFATAARTNLKQKQYDAAVRFFKQAITLKPADVDLQKELTAAELARDTAAAEARKKQEEAAQDAAHDKALNAGLANLKNKQYDAALVNFNEALKYDPDSTKAKAGLTQTQTALAAMKQDAAAQAEAKRKRTEYEKFMSQGQVALKLKQYDAALTAFQKAQDVLPGDSASADALKDATKLKSDSAAAQTMAVKNAEFSQAMTAARTALRNQKFDEATTAITKALTLKPTDADALKLRADLESTKKAAQAAMQKKEADAKKAAQVDALLDDARKALAVKDLDKANGFIAAAQKIDATDPDIKKVQLEVDAVRRSMASVASEAKRKQGLYEAAMRDASAAITAKKWDVAIAEASEALAIKPNDAAATQMLANAQKGKQAETSTAMEAKKKQEAYERAMRLAATALTAKQWDAAIKSATEALDLKPKDVAATKVLTDAQKGKADSATEAMEATKKKEAYDKAIATARAAMAKKDYDTAEDAAIAALKIVPKDPTAAALMRQAREAQADMKETVERKKNYDAWMARAGQLMQAKNYPQALEAYTNALKAMPNDPLATKGATDARTAMTAPKKEPPMPPKKETMPPIPPKKEPPKADPNAAKIAALMKDADEDEDAGRFAEAWRTYQEVLKLAPTNAEAKSRSTFCLWVAQGQRDLSMGKFAEASANFEQALKLFPNDANAKKLLAQSRAKKKN